MLVRCITQQRAVLIEDSGTTVNGIGVGREEDGGHGPETFGVRSGWCPPPCFGSAVQVAVLCARRRCRRCLSVQSGVSISTRKAHGKDVPKLGAVRPVCTEKKHMLQIGERLLVSRLLDVVALIGEALLR